jgi:TrbL/VirB6 plasmid conjugal transfer protein
MPTGPIPPDQVLDSALAAFLAAMHTYLPMLLIWGIALLSAAAFCGLGYALLHCITTHDWFGTIMNMAWAFARVMVIFMVYDNFQAIGSIFPTMGKIVGWQIAGLSPASVTPSNLYSMGLTIVSQLFWARHLGSWFNLVADAEFLILIVLTMMAWFAAATRFMFTLIETEWVFIKGAVTVCFAAFPHTFATLENWAVQMLRVGIRLIATLLIIAIAILLARGWTATLVALGKTINTNPVVFAAIQFSEAYLVYWAVWHLPQQAGAIVTSGGSTGGITEDQPGREAHSAITSAYTAGAKALIS